MNVTRRMNAKEMRHEERIQKSRRREARHCDKLRCKTRRCKTRCRRAYCKTLKNNSFFNKIVSEWRKKTHNGYAKMDAGRNYTCDYYLRENAKEDFWNHVHLIRRVTWPKKYARLRSHGYCFKKRVNGEVIHSNIYLINKKNGPRNTVDEIFAKYSRFIGA